jgi:hypothetical protein
LENLKTIEKRIDYVVDMLFNGNQSKLAEAMEIERSYMTAIKKGRRGFGPQIKSKLINLGLNPVFLEFGIEEPFLSNEAGIKLRMKAGKALDVKESNPGYQAKKEQTEQDISPVKKLDTPDKRIKFFANHCYGSLSKLSRVSRIPDIERFAKNNPDELTQDELTKLSHAGLSFDWLIFNSGSMYSNSAIGRSLKATHKEMDILPEFEKKEDKEESEPVAYPEKLKYTIEEIVREQVLKVLTDINKLK